MNKIFTYQLIQRRSTEANEVVVLHFCSLFRTALLTGVEQFSQLSGT